MAGQTITHTTNKTGLWNGIGTRAQSFFGRTKHVIKRNPLIAFLITLGILFAIISVAKLLQSPVVEKPQTAQTKTVSVYNIGTEPKATFQAKIEKSGVVQIVAQSAGIVQFINKNEGDKIFEGQQILSLSTNYQGGNAASVQRQISQTQYQNLLDTFDTQKTLIGDQRSVADETLHEADKQREIQSKSLSETKSMIDNNQGQLDDLNDSLKTLQDNNQNGANDEDISTIQGSINQLQSGLNQLRASQRTTEYQSADDKAPAKLSDLQKSVTQKQLDVQEKSLELDKEVSRLQVQLGYVNEAVMFPASPFTGKVEKVFVKEGESVTPGTILATIAANDIETKATVLVPKEVTKALQQGKPSELMIDDKPVSVTPYFISTQATDGQLYSVYYTVPEKQQATLSDGEYINITVPLGQSDITAVAPLIPIDAIYQTQDTSYVLVAQKEKAQAKTVKLGNVYGSYVTVQSGLNSSDQIILNRNVIAGEKVKLQ